MSALLAACASQWDVKRATIILMLLIGWMGFLIIVSRHR